MDIHLAQETTYADMAKDLSNEVVYCFFASIVVFCANHLFDVI